MTRSLTKARRALKGGYAYLRLVKDPRRTDDVFALVNELAGPDLMRPLASHFAQSTQGDAALKSFPRVGTIDLPALRRLAPGTLGQEYARFLDSNGLEPDFHPDLEIDNELDYVRVHLYETHDLWHVVTGFGSDVSGELGLQAFYLAQFPMGPLPPFLLAAGLTNTALFARGDASRRLDAIASGWRAGKGAAPLFGRVWAAEWERPIRDIRRELGLPDRGLVELLAAAG